MDGFGLVCLIALTLIVIAIFYAFVFLDFINPSALQVHTGILGSFREPKESKN